MCGSKTGTADKMKSLPYKELIGCILYCCLTRPDICAIISELAKYTADPGMPMWRAGLHLLKYLHSTSSMGLVFNPSSPTSQGDFRGFSDSGFNGSKDTVRSRCGHLVYFRSCLVGFKSLIQRATALSSCEAEYMAATQLTKDVVFFRMFASELGFPQKVPTQLAIDNKAAIAMTQSRMMTCRTRHMRRREHYVREQAAEQSGAPVVRVLP